MEASGRDREARQSGRDVACMALERVVAIDSDARGGCATNLYSDERAGDEGKTK